MFGHGQGSFIGDASPSLTFEDGSTLARAIVDTIRESLLVLNKDLRVIAASRSFYHTFMVERSEVEGQLIYDLGSGDWNVPELRLLLETILPQHTVMEAYEVEQDFPGLGRRTMLLNAREVFGENNAQTLILLAIEDITARHVAERELADLLEQKEFLLQEMQHRVANSLQIIASILLLKARTVNSEEIRQHLKDAHQRVLSVAAVQEQLNASRHGEAIPLAPYLTRLCESLAASMIGENRQIVLRVNAEGGEATSNEAVSIGLVVTELVINALKHGFVGDAAHGEILVNYGIAGTGWRLSVSDNGLGRPDAHLEKIKPGLGTGIVDALAKQLGARVEILRSAQGTTVSIAQMVPGGSSLSP